MFARLGQIEKSRGRLSTSFLYTHPTSEQRIKVRSHLSPPRTNRLMIPYRSWRRCYQKLTRSKRRARGAVGCPTVYPPSARPLRAHLHLDGNRSLDGRRWYSVCRLHVKASGFYTVCPIGFGRRSPTNPTANADPDRVIPRIADVITHSIATQRQPISCCLKPPSSHYPLHRPLNYSPGIVSAAFYHTTMSQPPTDPLPPPLTHDGTGEQDPLLARERLTQTRTYGEPAGTYTEEDGSLWYNLISGTAPLAQIGGVALVAAVWANILRFKLSIFSGHPVGPFLNPPIWVFANRVAHASCSTPLELHCYWSLLYSCSQLTLLGRSGRGPSFIQF